VRAQGAGARGKLPLAGPAGGPRAGMVEEKVHEMNMVWQETPQKEVIRWRIQNFAKVHRERGVPLESNRVTILDDEWFLELFPGGTTDSDTGCVAVFLTRGDVWSHSPTKQMDFSVSFVNQLAGDANAKKSAPPNSAFPGPMGIEDYRARVGWDNFARFADVVDPRKGFLVLGELFIEAEITPCSRVMGFLRNASPPSLQGPGVLQDLQQLWQSKSLSDVKLLAGDQEFSAHRAVLAARSSVFSSMFSSDMAEARSSTVTVVDVRPEVLELLLEFLYTDSLARQDAEPQLTGDLLKAAKKYAVPRLASLCESWALTAITLDSVVEWLMLATMLEAEQLKSACMRFVKSHCAEVQCTAAWQRLLADKQLLSQVMPCILEALCPPAKRLRTE